MKEVILAVEVPDAIVAGVIGVAIAVFIGLASWALLMLVKLSTVVAGLEARLEERSEDHERRLTVLEAAAAAAHVLAREPAQPSSSS